VVVGEVEEGAVEGGEDVAVAAVVVAVVKRRCTEPTPTPIASHACAYAHGHTLEVEEGVANAVTSGADAAAVERWCPRYPNHTARTHARTHTLSRTTMH
jgi:hypothetical protein